MPSPEHAALAEQLRAQPLVAPTVEEMRANFEQVGASFPLEAECRAEPVSADGVAAEWVSAPGAATDGAVLYLHGGGYVIGSINTHRGLAGRLSRACGLRVLLIDYRLAPEHPFPAAVEDATRAYRWILAQGVDPSRVVVAGDSAGGGLTVATAVSIRDAGDALPAALVCLSPWVDMEALGDSMETKAAADPMIGKEPILHLASAYLKGADPKSPLAAPLHADLSGLPPTLIQVGTAEVLLDDAHRLAKRATAAGVDVTLRPYEDLMHVFQLFPVLPEAGAAVAEIGSFVRARVAGASVA